MIYAVSLESDQPVHSCSLISLYTMLSHKIYISNILLIYSSDPDHGYAG